MKKLTIFLFVFVLMIGSQNLLLTKNTPIEENNINSNHGQSPTAWPDLSGTWCADIGPDWVYTVSQNRDKFSWYFKKFEETAQGRFTSKSTIEVSWQGGQGRGSATGHVTWDKSGKATVISWSNGVLWRRFRKR